MNNFIQEIKRDYKPYRLTKKKNVTIIDSTSGSFVIKEKDSNKISNIYDYLTSRNFDYFPPLVEDNRSEVNVFQYIDEAKMPREQKALDMMDLVALLHNKTTFFKEVTEDKYKEIYENLKNNINYLQNYYDNYYIILIEEVYPSPSHYLLMRNIYKIFAALDYATNELDNWYDEVKSNLKQRVTLVHNNLEVDHFIRSDKPYLVSWEKAKIDSPILDLINFYQKEYMNYDFTVLINKYLKNYTLNNQELKLFFIVLSIPPIINLDGEEMMVVKEIRKKLDYVFKTEKLIKDLTNDEDK